MGTPGGEVTPSHITIIQQWHVGSWKPINETPFQWSAESLVFLPWHPGWHNPASGDVFPSRFLNDSSAEIIISSRKCIYIIEPRHAWTLSQWIQIQRLGWHTAGGAHIRDSSTTMLSSCRPPGEFHDMSQVHLSMKPDDRLRDKPCPALLFIL